MVQESSEKGLGSIGYTLIPKSPITKDLYNELILRSTANVIRVWGSGVEQHWTMGTMQKPYSLEVFCSRIGSATAPGCREKPARSRVWKTVSFMHVSLAIGL